MFPEPPQSIPLQTVHNPMFIDKQITLSVLRIDKTDAIISGNKWFKLKYNLLEARAQGFKTLLSFGGPYSNHLHALAYAGKLAGFNTIGVIRGEEHLPLNHTLSDVTAQGMKLYYINRESYRNKHTMKVLDELLNLIKKEDPFSELGSEFIGLNRSQDKIQPFYIVPEGGTNALAVTGAAEISSFLPAHCDYIAVPCGTGGTIAGIISGLSHKRDETQKHSPQIIGFPAMKGGEFLNSVIDDLVLEYQSNHTSPDSTTPEWQLNCDYHFGGFGRVNKPLALFIKDFEKKHDIELDPIYTGKMMYAIVQLINDNFFPKRSHIIAVHTGGLQGKRGMESRLQSLLAHT